MQYEEYKRYKAATKIQSRYRGHIKYQDYKRYKGAQTIQALYRGRKAKKAFARSKQAAIRIQKQARIMAAKAELVKRRDVRECLCAGVVWFGGGGEKACLPEQCGFSFWLIVKQCLWDASCWFSEPQRFHCIYS